MAAGVAVGIVMRVWMLRTSLGSLDGDEAVVGLMARHILHGNIPALFWGNHYGGTQEPILIAGLFAIFGSSTFLLKLVPMVLQGVGVVLLFHIVKRLSGPSAAAFAAALYLVWPAYSIWRFSREQGFYSAGLVCGLAAVLLALRLRDRYSLRDAISFGAFVGLGWWATPQVVFLLLPAGLLLLLGPRERLKQIWPAIPSALIAAAPWLVWNLQHDWLSLTYKVIQANNSFGDHLSGFFRVALGDALGITVPFSHAPLLPVAYIVLIVAALPAAVLLYLRSSSSIALPFVIAIVYCPFIYSLSDYTWYVAEPRYLSYLPPLIAIVIAGALKRRAVMVAVLVVAALLSARGLVLLRDQVPRTDVTPLVVALEDRGIKTGKASYWIAYPVTFESREELIVTPDAGSRYQPYDEQVAADPCAATIFGAGAPEIDGYRASLQAGGASFEEVAVEGFVFFTPGGCGV